MGGSARGVRCREMARDLMAIIYSIPCADSGRLDEHRLEGDARLLTAQICVTAYRLIDDSSVEAHLAHFTSMLTAPLGGIVTP